MKNGNALNIGLKISSKNFLFFKKKLGNNYYLYSYYYCNLNIFVEYLYYFNEYNLDLHNFHIFFHFYIIMQYSYIVSI